jgi:hypothetical protein
MREIYQVKLTIVLSLARLDGVSTAESTNDIKGEPMIIKISNVTMKRYLDLTFLTVLA